MNMKKQWNFYLEDIQIVPQSHQGIPLHCLVRDLVKVSIILQIAQKIGSFKNQYLWILCHNEKCTRIDKFNKGSIT